MRDSAQTLALSQAANSQVGFEMKSGTGPSTQQPKLPDKTDPSQAKDQDKVEGVTQSMNGVGEHKLSREKQGSQASLVGSARSKGSARLLNAQRVK